MSKVSRAPFVPSSRVLLQPRAPHQLSIAFESTVTLDLSDSERTSVASQLATLLMQAAGLAAGGDDGQH